VILARLHSCEFAVKATGTGHSLLLCKNISLVVHIGAISAVEDALNETGHIKVALP
jgi:hypothetical protein